MNHVFQINSGALCALPREQKQEVIGRLTTLVEAIRGDLYREALPQALPSPTPDKALAPEEVASKLSVSLSWVYQNQSRLPGRVKLSEQVLRFSEKALDEHLKKGG